MTRLRRLLCRLGYCTSPSHRMKVESEKVRDDFVSGFSRGTEA